MPEISRFSGIVIQMYANDHGPPHFHARYGAETARVRLEPIEVMDSDLPQSGLRLVLEWAMLHESELVENWHRLRAGEAPASIAPLE